MNFENRPTHSLRPYPGNARTHSPKQIRQIARSIERFGFNNPVLVDGDDQIIAGHGRVEAAKLLNMKTVPTVRLSHLSEAEKKAYILADNRLAEKAGWDNEVLAIDHKDLLNLKTRGESCRYPRRYPLAPTFFNAKRSRFECP